MVGQVEGNGEETSSSERGEKSEVKGEASVAAWLPRASGQTLGVFISEERFLFRHDDTDLSQTTSTLASLKARERACSTF